MALKSFHVTCEIASSAFLGNNLTIAEQEPDPTTFVLFFLFKAVSKSSRSPKRFNTLMIENYTFLAKVV